MPEPVTSNIALIVPNTGDLPGTWGSAALNPDFASIDGFIGGVQTISASNANIVLTAPSGSITPSGGPTQAQNAVLRFTGALTANVQVTLPLPGYMIVQNLTTGNFVLSFVAASAGQVIATEQGSSNRIYNDGSNVYFTDLPPVGTYLDTCDAAVPAWITSCTVPPYLLCNGGTFNQTTYPYLYAKLGSSTTLPDARGRSRYMLGLGTGRLTSAGAGIDGTTILASGGNNGITASQLPAHSHPNTLTDPGHTHTTTYPTIGSGSQFPESASGPATSQRNASPDTGSSATGITINNANNSSGVTTMQNAAPGYVGGITMIRAA